MYIEIANLDIQQIVDDFNISKQYIIASINKYNRRKVNHTNNKWGMIMKEIVESRKIEFVVHFTRIENLVSILENGIKTRQDLETNNPSAIFNDEHRIDGFKDATCCSICHPNYKMFYTLRQSNPQHEWVVIGIKKDIIWEKDCAFCTENAASSNVTTIPVSQRKGKSAFMKLFKEIKGKPLRKDLDIPDSCPTNPQAEILVFDTIQPKDIIGVAFQNYARAEEYKKLYDNFEFIYHRAFFSARKDYEYWR